MILRERDRVRLAVLFQETAASLVQRPGWSVLTALGTIIGTVVLMVVPGLTTSVLVQVTAQFSPVETAEVRVMHAERSRPRVASLDFPIDTVERAMRVNSARNAGFQWELGQHATELPEIHGIRTTAVSAGTFGAAGVTFSQGRGPDAGYEQQGVRIAVIGSGAARNLRIDDLLRGPAVVIDGVPFAVVGIIDDTKRLSGLLAGVVIPIRAVQTLWHDPLPEAKVNLVVDAAPGTAQVVGPQLLIATPAIHPERFSVSLPPSPEGFRVVVNSQLNGLSLGLGVVCLIVGVIDITNTTIATVIEHTGEIGLQQAMGVQPRHIAIQFLLEMAVLDGLGGLVGTSLGVMAVVGTYTVPTWAAVMSPLPVAAGPLVGSVAGTLAGIYPPLRASRLKPVKTLRYQTGKKPVQRRGPLGGVSETVQTHRIRA